jgi:hypothetical protein
VDLRLVDLYLNVASVVTFSPGPSIVS